MGRSLPWIHRAPDASRAPDADRQPTTVSVVPGKARHAQRLRTVIVGIVGRTCANTLAGVGRNRSPLVLLPRICHARNASLARLWIALVFAERGLPVLATVEDAEAVDHAQAARPLPECVRRWSGPRLPRARSSRRRAGDLPEPLGRRLGQLGPARRRRHRRRASGYHLRKPRRRRVTRLHT